MKKTLIAVCLLVILSGCIFLDNLAINEFCHSKGYTHSVDKGTAIICYRYDIQEVCYGKNKEFCKNKSIRHTEWFEQN